MNPKRKQAVLRSPIEVYDSNEASGKHRSVVFSSSWSCIPILALFERHGWASGRDEHASLGLVLVARKVNLNHEHGVSSDRKQTSDRCLFCAGEGFELVLKLSVERRIT
jgi:hypothetical protein